MLFRSERIERHAIVADRCLGQIAAVHDEQLSVLLTGPPSLRLKSEPSPASRLLPTVILLLASVSA